MVDNSIYRFLLKVVILAKTIANRQALNSSLLFCTTQLFHLHT